MATLLFGRFLASCFSGRPRPWRMGMTSVKVRPGPVWPAFQDPTCIARPRPGLAPKRRPTPIPPAPAKRPRGVSPQHLPPAVQESNGGPAFPHQPTLLPPCGDPAPVSGGPAAGEAYSAWPTIEQGQQSFAHPRKPLITVSDIQGLPSAARAQWPDVSGLPADILTRVSKYLTFVTRHDPKTPATVEGFVLLESIASRAHLIRALRNLAREGLSVTADTLAAVADFVSTHSKARPYPPSPFDAA